MNKSVCNLLIYLIAHSSKVMFLLLSEIPESKEDIYSLVIAVFVILKPIC